MAGTGVPDADSLMRSKLKQIALLPVAYRGQGPKVPLQVWFTVATLRLAGDVHNVAMTEG